MKRVTLLVGDEDVVRRSDAYALTLTAPNGEAVYLAVTLHSVESVEDVPDPLPTEPGAVFYGRSQYVEPQRWFVTAGTGCGVEGGVDYVAANGHRILGDYVEQHGLVRLPDPDVTP